MPPSTRWPRLPAPPLRPESARKDVICLSDRGISPDSVFSALPAVIVVPALPDTFGSTNRRSRTLPPPLATPMWLNSSGSTCDGSAFAAALRSAPNTTASCSIPTRARVGPMPSGRDSVAPGHSGTPVSKVPTRGSGPARLVRAAATESYTNWPRLKHNGARFTSDVVPRATRPHRLPSAPARHAGRQARTSRPAGRMTGTLTVSLSRAVSLSGGVRN
jgi:hypothetical protein